MKLRNLIVAASLPFFGMVACGGTASDGDGDSTSPSSSSGKEETCAEFCEQLSSCDGVNVGDCTENCTSNVTTSRAGQEAINSCFEANLCAEDVSDAEGAAALICLLTEAASIETSSAAETYCDESVDAINDCLGNAPPEEDLFGSCKTGIGLASDEVLEGLNGCAELSCDDVQGCVEIEIFKALPIEALLALEDGEPSPALLADLLALGVVFGQLGLDDESGGGFDDLIPTDTTPPAMGGTSGR